MPFYQLHILNRDTLRRDRTHEFHANHDAAAIEVAETWIECAPMELCTGRDLIKRWDYPDDPAGSSSAAVICRKSKM